MWNYSLSALADAFAALADWTPPANSTRNDTDDPFSRPLLAVGWGHCRAIKALAEIEMKREARVAVVVIADPRGTLPNFVVSVGVPGDPLTWYDPCHVWLDSDRGILWLTSPFDPHPGFPTFRLSRTGIEASVNAPWRDDRDRELGQRHATIVLARLIQEFA